MKSILDDGFQAYLTEGAAFVGEAEQSDDITMLVIKRL